MTAPELVVPGDAADWLPEMDDSSLVYGVPGGQVEVSPPAREWLTVESLPMTPCCRPGRNVKCPHCGTPAALLFDPRPLRAGDTVTLRHRLASNPDPFAEAIAAEVLPIIAYQRRSVDRSCVEVVNPSYVRRWYWSDKNTQWQHRQIDLPDATPGGWAIRLTDVKETT